MCVDLWSFAECRRAGVKCDIVTHMSKYFAIPVISSLFLLCGSTDTDVPVTFSTTSQKITIVPAGGWHINESFPWRASAGSTQLKMNISWNEASVISPPGNTTVMGGICSATTCVTFKKILKVPK